MAAGCGMCMAMEMSITRKDEAEKAVDRLLTDQGVARPGNAWERFDAILARIDRIPEVPGGFDPLTWNEYGLPL
jgi:hypothetical protein